MSERNGFRNDLFFSRTNDFLNIYLPSQAVRSACTVKTYLDGLTVFRRYVTDTRKISMKKFRFSDCTHDFLLDFMAHLRDRGCKESTCNNRLAAVKSYLWYAAVQANLELRDLLALVSWDYASRLPCQDPGHKFVSPILKNRITGEPSNSGL